MNKAIDYTASAVLVFGLLGCMYGLVATMNVNYVYGILALVVGAALVSAWLRGN